MANKKKSGAKKKPQRKGKKKRFPTGWTVGILVVLGLAFLIYENSLPSSGPALIQQGIQIGASHFPSGDTTKGGLGQPVDGIACSTSEQLVYHIHSHLTLIVNGQEIAVPLGIGITPPTQVVSGFVNSGGCFYSLHTHDATGIIHVESPVQKVYTLGDFFDVWGEPLGPRGMAGYQGQVNAFINGKPYTGDPRNIPLTAHAEITVEIGTHTTPPVFTFPQGL